MTKRRVLEIFVASARFMTPDEVRTRLQSNLQRSTVYSYLSRLCRQGLLEPAQSWKQRVAYRITPRGIERLKFFQSKRV
jgi:Fe2+ or Zn2+ uptake regulation protein